MKLKILAATLFILLVFLATNRNLKRQAKKFLGVEETGNNAGFDNERFERLMLESGWQPSEAWCMAFVKMIVLRTYPRKKEVIEQTLNSGTQSSFSKMKNDTTGTFIFSQEPQKNAIVIWQSRANSSNGHAGIVTKVNQNTFETIEGNTNSTGSREGQLVARKTRNLNESSFKLLGFFTIT